MPEIVSTALPGMYPVGLLTRQPLLGATPVQTRPAWAEGMLVPGAATSGLSRIGTALRGPRELKLLMESPPATRARVTVPLPSAVLRLTPRVWVTLTVGMVMGVTIVASSPRPGGSPAALLAMTTAMAPAVWAFRVLVLKVHVPRSIRAMRPATAAALTNGAWQPSVTETVPSSTSTRSPLTGASTTGGP